MIDAFMTGFMGGIGLGVVIGFSFHVWRVYTTFILVLLLGVFGVATLMTLGSGEIVNYGWGHVGTFLGSLLGSALGTVMADMATTDEAPARL